MTCTASPGEHHNKEAPWLHNTPESASHPHQPTQAPCTPALPPLSALTARTTHALPLHPAALSSVPYGVFISPSSSSVRAGGPAQHHNRARPGRILRSYTRSCLWLAEADTCRTLAPTAGPDLRRSSKDKGPGRCARARSSQGALSPAQAQLRCCTTG